MNKNRKRVYTIRNVSLPKTCICRHWDSMKNMFGEGLTFPEKPQDLHSAQPAVICSELAADSSRFPDRLDNALINATPLTIIRLDRR